MTRIALPLLAGLLLVAGCGKKDAAAAADKDALTERTVKVAPVTTGDRVEAVEVIGELQGAEEIRVFAQLSERIRKLAVKEGDRVKEGDLLAVVVGDLQSEGVRQAQAALEAALANRDGLADNLKRTRTLVEGGSGTRGQLEAVEAQARAAEAQVRQATSALAQASAQQSRTTVRSPTTGVVASISLREGDLAAPGAPIMTVVRSQEVKAVLRVAERDFLRVEEGMPVRLSPLAAPQTQVDGTVSLKGPVVDRTTRTGLVEVHLPNQDGRLVAGSAVRVTIELSRRPGVVLVPAEAVLMDAQSERTQRATVFVAEGGKKALRREVKVGARQGGQLEIVEGLKAGEQLVVQGAHLLRDNNPIRLADTGTAKAQP